MKFSKFVKSLAPDGGAIYEYMDERWLASPSVLLCSFPMVSAA